MAVGDKGHLPSFQIAFLQGRKQDPRFYRAPTHGGLWKVADHVWKSTKGENLGRPLYQLSNPANMRVEIWRQVGIIQ